MRQADRAWRTSRVERLDAIRQAHAAGLGYGTIAKTLGVTRSYIQKVCNGGSEGLEGGSSEEPAPTPPSISAPQTPSSEEEPNYVHARKDMYYTPTADFRLEEPPAVPSRAIEVGADSNVTISDVRVTPQFCKHGIRWGRCCEKA